MENKNGMVENSNTSLVTIENSTVDDNSDETYSKALYIVAEIKTYQAKVRVNQFKIAIKLLQANEEKLYKTLGYKNIVEFAREEFGYRKANVYLLLSVAQHFLDASNEEKIQSIFANDNGDFSFSQLAEMTHISTDANKIREIINNQNITFSTPVKEIRSLSRELKSNSTTEPKAKTEKPSTEIKAENEKLKAENEKLKMLVEKLQNKISELRKGIIDSDSAVVIGSIDEELDGSQEDDEESTIDTAAITLDVDDEEDDELVDEPEIDSAAVVEEKKVEAVKFEVGKMYQMNAYHRMTIIERTEKKVTFIVDGDESKNYTREVEIRSYRSGFVRTFTEVLTGRINGFGSFEFSARKVVE